VLGVNQANPLKIGVLTSSVHGKGVFALCHLAAGETVIEYVGEIISMAEALRRHPHDPSNPEHTFYFHIDDTRVIDGLYVVTPHAGLTIRVAPTVCLTK
jgi:uncharacterized protein